MSTQTPMLQMAKMMGMIAILLLGMKVLTGSGSAGDKLLFSLVRNKFIVAVLVAVIVIGLTGYFMKIERSNNNNVKGLATNGDNVGYNNDFGDIINMPEEDSSNIYLTDII